MSKEMIRNLIVERFDRDIAPTMKLILKGNITVKPSIDQTSKNLEEAMNWMTDFIDCEIREYKNIRSLVSEDAWSNYEILDLKDTTEYKMLKSVTKFVMFKWKQRPSAIRRTYDAK